MNAQNPTDDSKPLSQILVGFDSDIDEQDLLPRLDAKAQSLFLELQSLAQTVQKLPSVTSPTTNFDVAKFLEFAQSHERTGSDSETESSKPLVLAVTTDHTAWEVQELGDYQLFEQIGRGGGGTVYRGRHKKLRRDVAVKILNRVDKRTVSRFEREMQTIGSLQHPNIVTATDAREFNGLHFLVMELLLGQNLSQVLRRFGPLPFAEACEIIRQASLGLAYVHENSLVHRDIKLSNLFLTSAGQVKILDLGLVLLREKDATVSNMTSTSVTMGSIDFMAPEQAEDTHVVDIRADIYSLGATFFTLLAGRLPFSGTNDESPIQKIAALASGKPPNLLLHRPDTPPGICRIVEQMMARFPSERYSTPAQVIDAITPFTSGAYLPSILTSDGTKRNETTVPANIVGLSVLPIAATSVPVAKVAFVRSSWNWILLAVAGCTILIAVYLFLHRLWPFSVGP
jgi:serine/threonine protein kinase